MKAELRQRIVAKYLDQLERFSTHMFPGMPKEEQIWKRNLRSNVAETVVKSVEASLSHVGDDKFEAVMAALDSMDPVELTRGAFKMGLGHLPKKHGGRPGTFSLDVRQRAIQDVGHEYPRCDSLAEAIEVVASRYGMSTEYLRKVWKNRKRLRRNERKKS